MGLPRSAIGQRSTCSCGCAGMLVFEGIGSTTQPLPLPVKFQSCVFVWAGDFGVTGHAWTLVVCKRWWFWDWQGWGQWKGQPWRVCKEMVVSAGKGIADGWKAGKRWLYKNWAVVLPPFLKRLRNGAKSVRCTGSGSASCPADHGLREDKEMGRSLYMWWLPWGRHFKAIIFF